MFGVYQTAISAIQRGETYENVGGTIREKQKRPRHYIPDEIRERIRADWATGQFSFRTLGKKYGCSAQTVWRIVNEGQPSSSPAKVTVEPIHDATE